MGNGPIGAQGSVKLGSSTLSGKLSASLPFIGGILTGAFGMWAVPRLGRRFNIRFFAKNDIDPWTGRSKSPFGNYRAKNYIDPFDGSSKSPFGSFRAKRVRFPVGDIPQGRGGPGF